jgi:Zinc finger, C3HC4 type (RING finger)
VHGLTDDSPYMNDPECVIDWKHVQRVVVDPDIGEIDRCPICLETPPIAPRLAKCGHIFCLTCVLRYMTEVSVECPLCMDRLYIVKPMIYRVPKSDLSIKVGDTIELELVARSRHGVHVMSARSPIVYANRALWESYHSRYSPLFHTCRSSLVEMYKEEQRSIEELRRTLEAHEKPEYCDRALDEIRVEMGSLGDIEPGQSATNDSATLTDTVSKSEDTLYYYFYQPRMKHRTFLANQDVKLLLKKYEHYTNFPTTLTTTIEAIDIVKLDAKLRGRYRYLDHLPLGTVLRFVTTRFSIEP